MVKGRCSFEYFLTSDSDQGKENGVQDKDVCETKGRCDVMC